jgi:peptidoglycan/xylan/chitin deacetylase (PgdA/CDA1 family)
MNLVKYVRLSILFMLLLSTVAMAGNSVNILVYHHVSSETPPSTSVTPQQFRQHLSALSEGPFQVVDLAWALNQIQTGAPLPDNAVAITFDDGYNDIHTNGMPLLVEFGMPFTVFVSTETIDRRFGDMMDWETLRDLQANGATIANHSVKHDYFVRQFPLDDVWLAAAYADITEAQTRIEAELGPSPKWFAYPYGEFNHALRDKLQQEGWIAFGQQSGGVGPYSDFQALPRFPAGGIYANWNTLKTKLMSRPLPVDYHALPDPITQLNPPQLVARLKEPLPNRQKLNCFVNGEWLPTHWENAQTFSIQPTKSLGAGRSRYNCTYSIGDGAFYWFSHQWLRP